MPTPLDFIRMVPRGEAAPPPIADLIGFTLTLVEPGRAVITFDAGPPVRTGRLIATGRLVKGGRTVGLLECDVVDDKDRLVARASSTCMTLRG
ncbi:MAG TPA: PaaI family thioesterase, partial [Methylomirabilota bacterium]